MLLDGTATQVGRQLGPVLRLCKELVAGCAPVLGFGSEFSETFDLVYDYTSFCALPVHLRRTYIREMAKVLAPGGHLLMLAFPMTPEVAGDDGRPPFLVTESDLAAATTAHFTQIGSFAAEDSPPERLGAERWFHFRKLARSGD